MGIAKGSNQELLEDYHDYLKQHGLNDWSKAEELRQRYLETKENTIISAIVGVFGASALWGIGELFSQKKRVQKGWFPMNPKRRNEYPPIDKNETLCPVHHGKSIYAIEDEDTPDTSR